jgi:hypothetical protein
MAMRNLTARVHRIRVLSKEKQKPKRQLLKEENITKSTMGRSLSTYKIRDKTKIGIHIHTRSIED